MKHISELNKEILQENKPDFVYERHKRYVANIPLAFDIETTSITTESGEKFASMYVWAFGLADSVYYGRTWEEFTDFIDLLSDSWELKEKKRNAIIYVHNLSYEFQFIRKLFSWLDVFAVDERKPIKALTVQGIEFRDSYILSGFNLLKTAENLTKHKIEKLTGDLDYSLIRHNETPLTSEEWGYIKNDILIIIYYIDEQIYQYGDIVRIPLTNTGRVRQFTRNKCFKKDGKRDNNIKTKYHNLMLNLVLSVDDYKQLKRAFMGGFTHANNFRVGEIIDDVYSIDFTSSYPSVMVSEKFPMSKPISTEVNTIAELENLMVDYNVLFDVKFTGIESSINYENYISESKCWNLVKPVLNNGRVFSADSLETTLTELDYNIIKNTYNYESISVANVKYFYKGYLPKPIIDSVLELYQGKTELKNVQGKETEYLLSKGMLNSIYGMTVTDIAKDDNVYFGDEWEIEEVNLPDKLERHNKSKNRFLYYAWGVWVTAYSRFNLWSGILAMGEDYVYSDTDSIKFTNYDEHVKYIESYNEKLFKKQEKVIEYYNLNPTLFKPKTIKGVEKPLGVWDFEGYYTRFKTLGAKRYLLETESGELEITVSGLSKVQGLEYMKNKSGSNTGVFNMFNDSLYIPENFTNKNTHTYIDEPKTMLVTDYLGNTKEVTELSGVHLEPVEFTLSVSENYIKFIKLLKEGYLMKGVKKL